MEAKDLRIGSYVMDSEINGDDIKTVCAVYSNSITVHDDTTIYNHELRGIPLTEEWLLKFGFKKYGKTTLFKKSNVTLNSMDIGHNRGDGFTLNYTPFVKVQHVHQLQNLYFALTGLELIYKPNK